MNSLSFPALGNYIDLLVDAVHVVDKSGYFLYMSPSAKQILGYTRAEMMGKQMHELVHPDDRKLTLQPVDKIVAGNPNPTLKIAISVKMGKLLILCGRPAGQRQTNAGLRLRAISPAGSKPIPQHGDNEKDLLHHADEAMYYNENQG